MSSEDSASAEARPRDGGGPASRVARARSRHAGALECSQGAAGAGTDAPGDGAVPAASAAGPMLPLPPRETARETARAAECLAGPRGETSQHTGDEERERNARAAAARFTSLPSPASSPARAESGAGLRLFDPSIHLDVLRSLLGAYKQLSKSERNTFADNEIVIKHVVQSLHGLISRGDSNSAAVDTVDEGTLGNSLQLSTLGLEAILHLTVLRTLELISEFAFTVDCVTQSMLSDAGAHRAVLACMRHGPGCDHWDVQEMGTIALRCMARAAQNIVTIAAAGGIRRILSSMREHAGVPTMQIEGFKALFNLAFDSDNQNTIMTAAPFSPSSSSSPSSSASSTHSQQPDGLSIIMAAFERHCDDELVQEFGCNLLHNLAFKNVENKQRIADRGCISTIVETSMSNHLGSAKVQIEACRALMSLGFFRPCQDIVQEVGGIEQIFETMAALRQVSDVQVEALKALCMLALNHGENKTRIIRGIDHILLSMKRHVSAGRVQAEGCGVLATLSFRNAEHKKVISNCGGVDAIVAAMHAHVHIADVQVDACKALASLAFDPTLQVEIAEKKGIEAIVVAMRCHQLQGATRGENGEIDSLDTLEEHGKAGGGSLANASKKDDLEGAGAKSSGPITHTQRKRSMRVQAEAAKALSELAYRLESNKQRITKAGGVEALVKAMDYYEHADRVQLEACRALFSLAISADGKERMVKIGVIPRVITSMRARGSSSAPMQDHGCRLLAELMYKNKENVELVRRADGVSAILKGLIQNSGDLAHRDSEENGKADHHNEESSFKSGNLEDHARKALDYFDVRTLLEEILSHFASATDKNNLGAILRLFVIVRSRMDKFLEQKRRTDANQEEISGCTPGSMCCAETEHAVTDETVRRKLIETGRKIRGALPEIWTRSVAKLFGGILRMFRPREGESHNPPSPCRASVRGMDHSCN